MYQKKLLQLFICFHSEHTLFLLICPLPLRLNVHWDIVAVFVGAQFSQWELGLYPPDSSALLVRAAVAWRIGGGDIGPGGDLWESKLHYSTDIICAAVSRRCQSMHWWKCYHKFRKQKIQKKSSSFPNKQPYFLNQAQKTPSCNPWFFFKWLH